MIKMGYYCAKCSTKVKQRDLVCPNCKSPLSKTRVYASEEELRQADKRLNGRKGLIRSKWLAKNILPFETWLAVHKNLTLREFISLPEQSKDVVKEEYKKSLEEKRLED